MSTTIRTIFSNIKADTPRAAKAVATTIQNGTTLLADGYTVKTWNKRNYRVENAAGKVYVVTYNAEQEHFHCTCEAHREWNICKHLVAVHLNKAALDAECRA